MRLPDARGPLTGFLISMLQREPGELLPPPVVVKHALSDDDLQLALYLSYELHYAGLEGVDDRWEWDPSLLTFRRSLEEAFESALTAAAPRTIRHDPLAPVDARLRSLIEADEGPPLARYVEREASLGEVEEFVIHRSAYQLKEADPHSWAIPRLRGRAKAALVEVQFDEYGSGDAKRMHATLFADTMRALGLDDRYGAYVERLPGSTLATVNLMSLFGLHRRWRGAIAGHLAAFEMTSPEPNRRYGNGLRRLGFGKDVTDFYDEHVEADSVHEAIASHDLAGALAADDPAVADDILFGASALLELEGRFARHLLDSWAAGSSSLLSGDPAASLRDTAIA